MKAAPFLVCIAAAQKDTRLSAGLAARDAVLMDSTRLSNTFTCQPQQRNMHGRIFGGFLMRRAYELAFATVHLFAGQRPRFVAVDRVRTPYSVARNANSRPFAILCSRETLSYAPIILLLSLLYSAVEQQQESRELLCCSVATTLSPHTGVWSALLLPVQRPSCHMRTGTEHCAQALADRLSVQSAVSCSHSPHSALDALSFLHSGSLCCSSAGAEPVQMPCLRCNTMDKTGQEGFQVDFKRPVDIGDLVTFESRVLHARNLPQRGGGASAEVFVEVQALVNRPEQVCTMPTNRFTLQCASALCVDVVVQTVF